jgi:hypothetical protein
MAQARLPVTVSWTAAWALIERVWLDWVEKPSPATSQACDHSCGTAPGPPANALFAFAGVELPSAVLLRVIRRCKQKTKLV